jgi:hypothetical protein
VNSFLSGGRHGCHTIGATWFMKLVSIQLSVLAQAAWGECTYISTIIIDTHRLANK